MQTDPIGYGDDLNLYTYVGNSPLNFADPSGMIAADAKMLAGKLADSSAGQFALGFVPGYDLASAFNNPGASALDYAIGVLGLIPGTGKGVGLGLKVGDNLLGAAAKGGRLGNEATRTHVGQVATEMESRGWKVTGGGGRGPEEYLPGPGGARRGSSYPDITATKGDKTLRVNTVDTRADGATLTTREAGNADRIRTQTGEHVLTIPKP